MTDVIKFFSGATALSPSMSSLELQNTVKTPTHLATLSPQNSFGNPTDVASPSVIEAKQPMTPKLVKVLKDFNSEQEIRNFDVSLFPCNVCFTERMGSQSIRFPGKHFFLAIALFYKFGYGRITGRREGGVKPKLRRLGSPNRILVLDANSDSNNFKCQYWSNSKLDSD